MGGVTLCALGPLDLWETLKKLDTSSPLLPSVSFHSAFSLHIKSPFLCPASLILWPAQETCLHPQSINWVLTHTPVTTPSIHQLQPPDPTLALTFLSWLKGTLLNYDTKYMHTASRPHSLDVYGDRDQTRGDKGASDVRDWWMSAEETSPSVLFPRPIPHPSCFYWQLAVISWVG